MWKQWLWEHVAWYIYFHNFLPLSSEVIALTFSLWQLWEMRGAGGDGDYSWAYSVIMKPWDSLQTCHHGTRCVLSCFQMSHMCRITIKCTLDFINHPLNFSRTDPTNCRCIQIKCSTTVLTVKIRDIFLNVCWKRCFTELHHFVLFKFAEDASIWGEE